MSSNNNINNNIEVEEEEVALTKLVDCSGKWKYPPIFPPKGPATLPASIKSACTSVCVWDWVRRDPDPVQLIETIFPLQQELAGY